MERIQLETKVLSRNDELAAQLRLQFRRFGVLCLNLISSPGSGKTSLLERTLASLPANDRVAVLTGDIQTENDARRLQRFGFPVRQITTGGTCHLDASMITRSLDQWIDLDRLELLFIENVGNLVCPSSYDLGEAAKVVVLSVTEGEEKPLKYPSIFFKSSLLVLNKIDLLPYVDFDVATAEANARIVHPGMTIVHVSCRDSNAAAPNSVQPLGITPWLDWLARMRSRVETTLTA